MCLLRSSEQSRNHRTALAERPLDLVHGPLRRGFRLASDPFLASRTARRAAPSRS
jgi:hypothetical protein